MKSPPELLALLNVYRSLRRYLKGKKTNLLSLGTAALAWAQAYGHAPTQLGEQDINLGPYAVLVSVGACLALAFRAAIGGRK